MHVARALPARPVRLGQTGRLEFEVACQRHTSRSARRRLGLPESESLPPRSCRLAPVAAAAANATAEAEAEAKAEGGG